MKKAFIGIFSASLLFVNSGCLKDKGYEDNKYGINIKEVKGVSFPQSQHSPVISAITAAATPIVLDGPVITLEQAGAATADVHVTLVLNNTLVTAEGLTVVPASAFTVNSLQVTIPAGQKFSEALSITLNNSNNLNPLLTYGIGFTISAVDGGYTIVENQKNLVVAIPIKNKYDGVYNLRIRTDGWAAYTIADGISGNFGEIEMPTVNATSIAFFDTHRTSDQGLQPAFTGGVGTITGTTGFGATTPLFIFNTTTDQLTDVTNTTPDDGRGRVLLLNPAITTSRYDPATRTIYAAYILKQNGRPDLFIYDTLSYLRARD